MKEAKDLSEYGDSWQGSPGSIEYKPGRIGFVLLLCLSSAGILGGVFLLWYIPTVGLGNISPILPYVLGSVLLAGGIFVVVGAISISIAVMNQKVFFPAGFRGLLVRFFLPIMVMVGRGILGIPRIRIERAFIEVNNHLVRLMKRRFKPEKILILMPHCIQYENCKIKITKEVKNCVGCGRCEIGELIDISERYGVNLFVSTGGTIARKKVHEYKPDAVIAVACERDLTSGVQDAYPLPVLAIVNRRPRGYCEQTGVAVEEIKQALHDLLG